MLVCRCSRKHLPQLRHSVCGMICAHSLWCCVGCSLHAAWTHRTQAPLPRNHFRKTVSPWTSATGSLGSAAWSATSTRLSSFWLQPAELLCLTTMLSESLTNCWVFAFITVSPFVPNLIVSPTLRPAARMFLAVLSLASTNPITSLAHRLCAISQEQGLYCRT